MANIISAQDLNALLQGKSKFALIDVREAGEYNSSHIADSSLIPRKELEFRMGVSAPVKGEKIIVCDDDGRIFVQVLGDVGHAKGQLSTGHAASAGNAETLVLLGGAGVQYHQLVAPLDALVQFSGLNLRNVVLDLHPLAEVLADHVAAPLGGIAFRGPLIDAPVQDRNVAEAHALQCGGGQCRPAAVIVAHLLTPGI